MKRSVFVTFFLSTFYVTQDKSWLLSYKRHSLFIRYTYAPLKNTWNRLNRIFDWFRVFIKTRFYFNQIQNGVNNSKCLDFKHFCKFVPELLWILLQSAAKSKFLNGNGTKRAALLTAALCASRQMCHIRKTLGNP